MKKIAWGCRVCNKIDWVDTDEQLAQPEHRSYRGVDLGTCSGVMITLYIKEDKDEQANSIYYGKTADSSK